MRTSDLLCYNTEMLTASLAVLAVVFTNMTDLVRGIRDEALESGFDVEARLVTLPRQGESSFAVDDGDNRPVLMYDNVKSSEQHAYRRGDVVRLKGVIRHLGRSSVWAGARCDQIAFVRKGESMPVAEPRTIRELLEGNIGYRLVSVTGTVRDAFQDEIDSHTYFLALEDNGELIYTVYFSFADALPQLFRLVGSEVRVSGIFEKHPKGGLRPLLGNLIITDSLEAIEVLRAPEDPFAAPALESSETLLADDVRKLGRRLVVGRVMAVWGGNRVLLRRNGGLLVGMTLATDAMPKYGDLIEASGFAETDLYRINLARAVWRPRPPSDFREDDAHTMAASELFTDKHGKHSLNQNYYGTLVRLEGTVKPLADAGLGAPHIEIDTGDYAIPVETAACGETVSDLSSGTKVRVTGIFVIDAAKWEPYSVFPRARGCLLVPRKAGDVVVLSRPPWWTPKRLLIVIGALLLALVSIAVWNRILNRLVERRSRQLLKANAAQAQAALRTEERTRLAVELHDTIAQNLTGAALQLDAIGLAAEHAPDTLGEHIANARRTLQNCRENLRNCLWDLRSRVLEEPHFADAIRRTVQPLAGAATIDIACNVATRRFSDNASHAVLSIVRELVTNAVRHGRAAKIAIAGGFEDTTFSLAVTDDGIGFDPNRRPGIREGHFGLQGVSERVHRLGGTLVLDSAPGKGTRATITGINPS